MEPLDPIRENVHGDRSWLSSCPRKRERESPRIKTIILVRALRLNKCTEIRYDNGVCVVHFLFVCLFILCLCVIAVLIGVRISSASAGVEGILVAPIHNNRSSSNEHTVTTTATAND